MELAFNPMDPAVTECPFDHYAAMHDAGGVVSTPFGMFVVAGHDLLSQVLVDTATFSSDFGRLGDDFMVGGFGGLPDDVARVLERGHPIVPTLLTCDPPEHTRYRALVAKVFTPRRVAALRPHIEEVASDLLDGFPTAGEVDLVGAFAVPFPLTVIADQLGVSRGDLHHFKRWSDDSVRPLGGFMTPEAQLEVATSVVELHAYFEQRIDERRAGHHDDLLAALVGATADGVAPLTTPEILSIVQQLLVAGNETTTKLISSGIDLLLDRPDLQDRLRREPEILETFVEEVLRTESPLQGMLRIVTRDTSLGGVDLPANSLVIAMFAAANRDPAVFDAPDEVRADRGNARSNLAFGKGPHFCPGAALARAEAEVAFRLLLERLGPLTRGSGPVVREPSLLLRGIASLPIRFADRDVVAAS